MEIELWADGTVLARASADERGVCRLVAVGATQGQMRRLREDAFGADNVLPLCASQGFSALLDAFPAGVAAAFGAIVAIPR